MRIVALTCAALALCATILLLACPVARAGGVNLTWSTVCWTEQPVSQMAFACNTNNSSITWPLTVSFAIDSEMTDFVGVEIIIRGQSDESTLQDWWKMGAAPDCRSGGLVTFSADKSGVASETCLDWTAGTAFQVFGFTWGGRAVTFDAGAALDASTPFALQPGIEYYGGTLTIRNGRTVGDGACAGCSIGMVLGVYYVVAAGLGGRRDELSEPLPGGNACVFWNSTQVCCGCGAAERATWGQVKTLYR